MPRRFIALTSLAAGAAIAVTLALATPALAKGTTQASITGPPLIASPLGRPVYERMGYTRIATHTLFNGTFSTALNVVDQADPENSLILRKPTSSSETEGVAGSATLAHGGGIRFTKDSPEYATILEWIKGAKE